jgi:hypothetical protein
VSASFAQILDALRDLWTPVLAAENVPVRDTGDPAYAPGEYLMVGATGPDPGEGVEITPQRAGLGRAPTHQVRVPCLLWTASGEMDPRLHRTRAVALYGLVTAALQTRAGRGLGGLVDTADVVSASYRHHAGQGGSGAAIEFVVQVNAL